MDAELIKTTDEQGVMYSLLGDNLPENYVLSPKNCQAIELGYDLDELVKSKFHQYLDEDGEEHWDSGKLKWAQKGFIEGVKAIIEILGDKKFSEEEMIREMLIWDNHINIHEEDKGCIREISQRVKSLQQTEWEVVVITKNSRTGKIIKSESDLTWDEDGLCDIAVPVFDADNNLILKRK